MTQKKIAELFELHRSVITMHLNNIFESGEIDEKLVSSMMELTTQHIAIFEKMQSNPIKFYNLICNKNNVFVPFRQLKIPL